MLRNSEPVLWINEDHHADNEIGKDAKLFKKMNLVKPNHNAKALILTTRLTKENADENNFEYEHFLRSDEKLMATNAYLSV